MSQIYASNNPGPWDQSQNIDNITKQIINGNENLESFEDGIDLREELRGMIQRHGHWIALRKITNQRCPNYDPSIREEHARECRFCMGTGYRYQDFILKSYARPSVLIETAAGESRQHIGMLSHDVRVYYFPGTTRNPNTGAMMELSPTSSDYIIELRLENDSQDISKTYRFRAIYNIQLPYPLRDRNGRIEYWMCKVAERATGA